MNSSHELLFQMLDKRYYFAYKRKEYAHLKIGLSFVNGVSLSLADGAQVLISPEDSDDYDYYPLDELFAFPAGKLRYSPDWSKIRDKYYQYIETANKASAEIFYSSEVSSSA